jgi:hypothetical protein
MSSAIYGVNTFHKQLHRYLRLIVISIDQGGRGGAAESISRVSAQGEDINVLDGKAVGGMIAVHAASALSGVNGRAETRDVDGGGSFRRILRGNGEQSRFMRTTCPKKRV